MSNDSIIVTIDDTHKEFITYKLIKSKNPSFYDI